MTKHIIIGTSGIGAALARGLAAHGASVHLIGREGAKVAVLAAELNGSFAVADVLDDASLIGAVQAAGPVIDGLAYCVGTINLKPMSRLSDGEILKDFEVNALGALRAIRAALPALKASTQNTSSILLFSTVAVQQGFTSHASVAMAKGAIEGLTRALAAEFAPKIRVNAIAPSLTRTPLAAAFTANPATAQAIAGMHALPRLGEPEDMVGLGALLLSEASSWMTGQIIGVDGGRSSLRVKA